MAHAAAAILGTAALAVVGGCGVLWSRAFGKWSRGEPLLPLDPRRPVPWGLFDLAIIFLLLLTLIVASQFILLRTARLRADLEMAQWTTSQLAWALLAGSLATLLAAMLAVAVLVARARAGAEDLGFALGMLGRDFKLGAAGFVMLAPPMYGLQFVLTKVWPSEHPVQRLLMERLDAGFVLIALFTAVLVAPLAEEVLFRLVLQGWLENVSVLLRRLARGISGAPDRSAAALSEDFTAVIAGGQRSGALREPPVADATLRLAEDPTLEETRPFIEQPRPVGESLNPYAPPQAQPLGPPAAVQPQQAAPPGPFLPAHWPMVASAAVFALLHFGHGPDPIPLFLLAVGLGYLYQRTHRITPCVVVHLLVNSASMLMLIVSLLFPDEFGAP